MPRPASNIDTFSSQAAGYYSSTNGGAETRAEIGPFAYKWVRDIHPAGSSSPMVNGFRPCHNWLHKVGEVTWLGGNTCRTINRFNPSSVVTLRFPDGSYWPRYNLGTIPEPVSASSNMINAALVGALDKLKSQDVHLGNFFAEAHKTIDMIGGTATKIAKQVTSFKARYPRDWAAVKAIQRGGLAKNLWCTIPNGWLQLQYGWSPLLQDIVGSMMHLYRRSRFDIPYVRVHKRKKDTVETTTRIAGYSGGWLDITWQHDQQVDVYLAYEVTSPLLAELSSLGLINPLEIVWEITKYSFVVDWFLPVGSWLSALTADVGMSFKTGGHSDKTRMTFKKSVLTNPTGVPPYFTFDLSGEQGFAGSRIYFQRTCYAGSPVPGLYVKSPLSLAHAANGIALLMQAFR
jgi:hypothetical protein